MAESPKRVEKPWGYELWWARTERYVGKILHVRKGESLSLQYHRVKEETIMVQSGRLLFETRGKDEGGELRRIVAFVCDKERARAPFHYLEPSTGLEVTLGTEGSGPKGCIVHASH